jgi:hypothetical protein
MKLLIIVCVKRLLVETLTESWGKKSKLDHLQLSVGVCFVLGDSVGR